MRPQFSVLIPVYNREEFVRQSIDSVLSQTCSDYELIVVDDGSTDRTPNALNAYGNRIKVIRQSNQGSVAAKNKAASIASGEYFVFLDSDDILLPFALSTYKQIIAELNSPPILIAKMEWFEENLFPNDKIATPTASEVYLFRDYLSKTVSVSISFSVIVISRTLFKRMGGLKSESPSFDDLDFMLRVGTSGPCAIVKSPITVGYRSHPGNTCRVFDPMVRALSTIAEAELRGDYSGGSKRLIDRRAYIGSMAMTWVQRALQSRHIGLAAGMVMKYGTMIMISGSRKFYSKFINAASPHIVPLEIEQKRQDIH
jgi:glycosyltransferase involved in cell wall biosynthesis